MWSKNGVFNSLKICGHENGVFNRDGIKTEPCDEPYSRLVPNDCDGIDVRIQGRGLSGVERGGGTPPTEQLGPNYFKNDLDEEDFECAMEEMNKNGAEAVSPAHVDDFSSSNL